MTSREFPILDLRFLIGGYVNAKRGSFATWERLSIIDIFSMRDANYFDDRSRFFDWVYNAVRALPNSICVIGTREFLNSVRNRIGR
jgi:hypothetical protein